jgi:hypothetical protein
MAGTVPGATHGPATRLQSNIETLILRLGLQQTFSSDCWEQCYQSSGHVEFVAHKVVMGQVFSQYFGIPCQFSFHGLLHTHFHVSSAAGTIGRIVADLRSGLSLIRSWYHRPNCGRLTKWTQCPPPNPIVSSITLYAICRGLLGCDTVQLRRSPQRSQMNLPSHALNTRRAFPPKHWCLHTRLHGVTSQKPVYLIFADART